MSNENQKPEPFTQLEKRVLLSETTFVSVGMVVIILSAAIYVVSISNKQDAQANTLSKVEVDVQVLEVKYLDQLVQHTKEIGKVNARLSRFEGRLNLPPMPEETEGK